MEYAAQHPEFAFGVHTTLTNEWDSHRWKPLTAGKTLVGEDGYMWRTSEQVEKNASYADIEAEVRAQIELAHSLGMKPSHVDNHMGTLYGHYTGRFGLGKLALRLCGEYGYSYRFFTKYDKRIAPEGIPRWLYQGITLLTKIWGKRYKTLMPDYLLFPDWTDDLRVSYEHYRETILKIWVDIPEGI
ncbi:MAG: ChbG/HpnK family deacetylase, partial [Clostridia bacterium]|nr:ChbG/HpnK family deacetylase [Clostridia bacterium]